MSIENGQRPPDSMQETKQFSPEKVTFDEKNFTLLLDLDKAAFELEKIQPQADATGLTQKDEFHITAIGFKGGAEIKKSLKALDETARQEKIQQIQSLISSTDWHYTIEPQQLHIAKDYPTDPKKPEDPPEHRESFIQLVNVPAMESFYSQLNGLLGTAIEAPPSHITLFTGGNKPESAKQGIGINTPADLEKLNPKPINT